MKDFRISEELASAVLGKEVTKCSLILHLTALCLFLNLSFS